MECKKIDNKLFEWLFDPESQGTTQDQMDKRDEEAKKKKEKNKKKNEKSKKKKAIESELMTDNDNKKMKTLGDDFEAPKQKHNDEHIKEFSKTGKIPKDLKPK